MVVFELFDKGIFHQRWEWQSGFGQELVLAISQRASRKLRRYANNLVFQKTMSTFGDVATGHKLTPRLCKNIRLALKKELPHVKLSKNWLRKHLRHALFVCDVIATELADQLKPQVTFTEDAEGGDARPQVSHHTQRLESQHKVNTLYELCMFVRTAFHGNVIYVGRVLCMFNY